nr:helicase-related protein [Aliamphritea spongicola]
MINYQLPHNAEDYIHRIGRTGRAGREGLAVTLMSQDELHLLEPIETLWMKNLTGSGIRVLSRI